jgi:catalase
MPRAAYEVHRVRGARLNASTRLWRNWKTRGVQVAVSERTCGFESHQPHSHREAPRVVAAPDHDRLEADTLALTVISPEQAIEAIDERYGYHPGRRAFHAKGTLWSGTFRATPEAARLTRAAHMQGRPVPVTVRFSNGSGDPNVPDYALDLRGLAVTFHLADGARTDLSAQTVPRFPFRDVDPFIELVRVSKPGLTAALKMPLFLARHPRALGALRANLAALQPPPSFAARRYYALHAFKWLDAEGGERYVRYTWKPTVDLPNLGRGEAKARGRDYLSEELVQRIQEGPVRFELEVQIAADGDDPDDPSSEWPEGRERVVVGTLEVTAPTDEGDDLVFDPTRLVDGIEPSDDPILRFRPRAYAISHERRTAGAS